MIATRTLQPLVVHLVGDAEPASADHPGHDVAVVEHEALGQFGGRSKGPAAPGADKPAPVERGSTPRVPIAGVNRWRGLAHWWSEGYRRCPGAVDGGGRFPPSVVASTASTASTISRSSSGEMMRSRAAHNVFEIG